MPKPTGKATLHDYGWGGGVGHKYDRNQTSRHLRRDAKRFIKALLQGNWKRANKYLSL